MIMRRTCNLTCLLGHFLLSCDYIKAIKHDDKQEGEPGSYLCSLLWRREGFAVAVRRVRAEFTLQENLLAAGVAPHSQRGQVHREVVSRLLRTKFVVKGLVNRNIRPCKQSERR